ncbi:dual specificity catalytic domain containing protein [Moniliophthora roreri MCA 2997]|uniref:protein-tyrosine-phosphatase n=1 Tax=Moniliophthora roreri (strain MCA 2997) TaxID=1381753 RepID=V2Z338_MONRO|nr:dual specificity catalytic domain containing protein [Moniliophthora roreri MCA 2997]
MSAPAPRKRPGPPAALHIDLPTQAERIAIALGDASATSSATSEEPSPFSAHPKPKSLRNMKNLSLNTLSARSSTLSLRIPEPQSSASSTKPELQSDQNLNRRPSVISLPNSATANRLFRKEEDSVSPTVPYADGPVQILPGIWLGSEDNARDIPTLLKHGIRSILNVAKEVSNPFESTAASTQHLRSTVSTPNLYQASKADSTYYPPHPPSGRPGMHYLKLQWSHGQQNLVADGFPSAMEFTDAAQQRGEGVLIHCQCGVSRSATLVIALVMRAAADRSPNVPSEVWALKGMQGAYDHVKEKSKTIGPNMSLIYQLLEYEKKLKGSCGSPNSDMSSNVAEEEEEWGRRRQMLDDAESDPEEERESSLVMQEAQALDKAMEDRVIARKASGSSIASTSTGIGMGAAWRSRFGNPRKRTGSIASNGSVLSEDLVEEDEEQDLLGVGKDSEEDGTTSADRELSSSSNSPEEEEEVIYVPLRTSKSTFTPTTARPPPTAPVWKSSFNLPLPATAIRSTFDLSSMRTPKPKRRPAPLGPIPPSPPPIAIVTENDTPAPLPKPTPSPRPRAVSAFVPSSPSLAPPTRKQSAGSLVLPPMRSRTTSRKPAPPPLHLRSTVLKKTGKVPPSQVSTPSQTLFVFPPSPTLTTRTPSTMTLTSNVSGPVPFPSLSTPRISSFRADGRTRSFIGLAVPPTPTTAFSKVDARGYVALE